MMKTERVRDWIYQLENGHAGRCMRERLQDSSDGLTKPSVSKLLMDTSWKSANIALKMKMDQSERFKDSMDQIHQMTLALSKEKSHLLDVVRCQFLLLKLVSLLKKISRENRFLSILTQDGSKFFLFTVTRVKVNSVDTQTS